MTSGSPFKRTFRPTLFAAATALTAVAAATALFFGLHSAPVAANAPAVEPALPVSVATVTASQVAAWDEFSGRLEAVDRVEVRSRAAGTVQAVHFREGALVHKGDLLFTIDAAPYAAEFERAEAQVVAARSRLLYATSEFERAKRLWDDHAIAQREFDDRSNAHREAEANLRAALANQQSAKLNLDYTQVRAPIAGRIGKVQITAGNLVAAGPTAPVLVTLVSVSPIYASFDADEQIIAKALKDLRGGARDELSRIPVRMGTAASTDLPFEGRLQLVDNQVDAKSGTIRVRAVFDNKDGTLIPGQFARLQMGSAHAGNVLLVNERAVGTDQDKRYVMVVGADDIAAWRQVTLGASVNGLRIVSAGLQAGERVVVGGVQRVRPGTKVAPKPVPMDAKPEVQAAKA
ncbi:MAG: efflux RND transporter periplasmic adaptor subunit [Burkholderiales bacterium]